MGEFLISRYFTVTNLIIVLSVIGFGVQNSIEYGSILLGLNSLFFTQGLYYQLLSTIFTHGNLLHISMNMLVLYQFGNLIERYRGRLSFVMMYIGGGVATSLLSILFMYYFGLNHNLVGASGAISVLLGFYAHLVKSERKGIIIWIGLISFAPLLIGINVAWYAHIFGFFIGWLLGFIHIEKLQF